MVEPGKMQAVVDVDIGNGVLERETVEVADAFQGNIVEGYIAAAELWYFHVQVEHVLWY